MRGEAADKNYQIGLTDISVWEMKLCENQDFKLKIKCISRGNKLSRRTQGLAYSNLVKSNITGFNTTLMYCD